MDEDENKTDHWINKHINDRLDKATWKEKMYKETVEMLQTEERFVNYFKQFHPLSIEGFIKFYAQTKVSRYEYAEVMKKERERKDNQFNVLAEWALVAILKFKVDKLKSKWDKGLMKEKEIIFYDFSEWEEDPLTCPYIEPVSIYDIEEYLEFYDELWKEQDEYILENGDPDDDDYEEDEDEWFYFKKEKVDGMKEVGYEYSNWMKKRNGMERNPFPARGAMEGRWMQAARAEETAKNTPPPPVIAPVIPKTIEDKKKTKTKAKDSQKNKPKDEVVQPPPEPVKPAFINDRRKFLSLIQYDPYELERFIKTLDTKEVLQNYRAMHRTHDTREFTERIEMDLYTLGDAKEHVPIQSHDDWRKAVAEACELYKRRKVREAIVSWWEVYNEILLSGMKYEYINTMPPKKFDKTIRETLILQIKRGRELAGEPGNMDY